VPSALAAALAVAITLTAPAAPSAPTPSPGTAYYLDCSRTAAGDGSAAAPWSSTIDASHHEFQPGDRLLVKRGTTCHGQLAPRGEGSPGHPIVLDAYGSGALPTIAGDGTWSWNGAVQLTDQAWWTIRNLHVTNTAGKAVSEQYRSGVLVLNDSDRQLHGVVIERLRVDSVVSNMSNVYVGPRSFGGISVLTTGTGGFTGLQVRNNLVSHVGRTGIVVSNNSYPAAADHDVRITGNRVERIRGDGVLLLGSRNGRIDHNVSAYAAQEWPCPDCGPITRFTANVAIWTGASDRTRMDHNEAYGTKMLGGDGEGFDVDSGATNTIVEYNYAHDNEGGGILFCGSTNTIARFNIFENNKKSAIAFIGTAPAKNTVIHNNTLYAKKSLKAGNVRTFNGLKGSGIRFFNNLVYNGGQAGWTFPTKRIGLSSNTILGHRGHDEPHGPGFSRVDPRLRLPGTGRVGASSLTGYKPADAKRFPRGKRISSTITRDFFGKRTDPTHPPRGAAG
jgi:parallel beta-helix repeat protein